MEEVKTPEDYQRLYQQSIQDPADFWAKMAKELVSWDRPFKHVQTGSFKGGDVEWFGGGRLNACYNCVDRHAEANPDKTAIIWEHDEPGRHQCISYGELKRQVCQLANLLTSYGLRQGDRVTIYLPMIPASAISVLACARLGLVHVVVFAGFSAVSLAERIVDSGSQVVVTCDQAKRGGRIIPSKEIVDEAISECPEGQVRKVIVFQHTEDPTVPFHPRRDVWWHEGLGSQRPVCPAAELNSEDPLFLIYTSGSTGKPKGVLHTVGGYLVGVATTIKYVFGVRSRTATEGDEEVFGCMADVGWITGHSYAIYGPLVLGATSVLFEGTPMYPDASRYWQMISKHRITHFYTAPTAIRALRKMGAEQLVETEDGGLQDKYDLSRLRVIGSVGEPINPEAWYWYNEHIGRRRCPLVDTYWQTETGAIMIAPMPGAINPTAAEDAVAPLAGCAALPFFGVDPVLLDAQSGREQEAEGVLAIRKPWPSMARTIGHDHQRYMRTYFAPYPGFYFCGDSARRDAHGYYWIGGRVDDVINVSGHRLGTAEIESALVQHPAVAEAAVVGIPDEVTGQSVCAFATLKTEASHRLMEDKATLEKELVNKVRSVIGPFAAPKRVEIVEELPKTRSGKIVRRLLRKVLVGEHDQLGDTSGLADESVVEKLIQGFGGAALSQ